jgi:hypothetical protein
MFGSRMIQVGLTDDVQTAPPGLSTTLQAAEDMEAIGKAKAVHGKDAKVVFVRYPLLMCRQ